MNTFYYPYKPEKLDEIRIILFIPSNDINVVIISHPNLKFEHHRLLQVFLKDNKEFRKYIKLKINKFTFIYDLSIEMANQNIATFVNCSSEPYESGYITIPTSIKTDQIDNIFSFDYFFDTFSFPIDATIVDLYKNVTPINIGQNNDLYSYLNNLKILKENNKVKRL